MLFMSDLRKSPRLHETFIILVFFELENKFKINLLEKLVFRGIVGAFCPLGGSKSGILPGYTFFLKEHINDVSQLLVPPVVTIVLSVPSVGSLTIELRIRNLRQIGQYSQTQLLF